MELLRCKARLSVLWLTMAVGTMSGWFLGLIVPGTIAEVITGEWAGVELSEGVLVFMAVLLIIPMAVAILSLTLNGSANRWLNFVLGIIYILCLIADATAGTVYVAQWLMFAAGIVISAFIVYFAWKLPKQEA